MGKLKPFVRFRDDVVKGDLILLEVQCDKEFKYISVYVYPNPVSRSTEVYSEMIMPSRDVSNPIYILDQDGGMLKSLDGRLVGIVKYYESLKKNPRLTQKDRDEAWKRYLKSE